jgi:lipopolysaccharide biosynthesis glycosyltransferase
MGSHQRLKETDMENKLNLFFTIDQNYLQHFTVALTSLLENNRDLNLGIYVIHDIADSSVFDRVSNFFRETYQVELSFIAIESSLFDRYKITSHVSKATYFRLLLSDILPADIDSGLFLDADIIVTNSLGELADAEFNDSYLLAYYDNEVEKNVLRLNNMGVPADKYFNAGVMLINLKKWREAEVSSVLTKMAEKHMDDLLYWDQDVLNLFFYNKWGVFDGKYNSINLKNRLEVTPTIIHYATAGKPWHYLSDHPYRKLYFKYKKLTPYRHTGYADFTYINFLKKNYRRIKRVYAGLISH